MDNKQNIDITQNTCANQTSPQRLCSIFIDLVMVIHLSNQ